MKRRTIVIDSLPKAERRRVEALALAIAMNRDGYPDATSYFADAEEIERWIEDATRGREDDPPAQVGGSDSYAGYRMDDADVEEFEERERRYG